MAIEIATAYVSIVPSARGFTSRLRSEIGGGATAAGSAAGGDFESGFMSRMAGMGKAVGLALTSAVAAAGGFGLKVAAETETATIGFETLLGSSEKAQAYLADLSKFAAETPFDLPGLRRSASQLIAVGLESERVIPLMTSLGDATSAFGTGAEGISRATRALTQMQQKGKVQAQEMLQLAEAGVPAWEALATTLGVDVATAQGMVTEGQVKANTVFEAIEKHAGPALGRVQGMMEKQATTLTGMWSTFKDLMSQGLGEAMGPAIVGIKSALPEVTTILSGALKDIAPQLGEVVKGFVDALKSLLPIVGPMIGTLAHVIGAGLSAVAPILTALAPIFGEISSVLGEQLAGAIAEIAPLVVQLAQAFAEMAPIFGFVLSVVGHALSGVVQQLLPELLPLIKDLAVVFYALAVQAQPLIAALGRGLGYALGTLAHAAVMIVDRLGGPLVDVFVGLVAAIVPLLDKVPELADAFLEILPELLSVVLAIVPMLPKLVEVLPPIADAFLEVLWAVLPLVPMLADLVINLLPLIDAIVDLFVALASDPELLKTLVVGLIAFVGVMKVIGTVTTLISGIGTIIGVVVPALTVFVSTIAGIIAAASGATGVFGTLGAVIAATPIGWIIGLVVVLGAALYIAYQKIEPFHEAIDAVGRALAAAFGWVKEFGAALFTWDTDKLTSMLSELGNTIKTFLVETLPGFITEQAPKLLEALWGWLSTAVPELLIKLGGLLAGFAVWYYTVAVPWLIENGIKLAGALLGWLADIVPDLLGKLAGLLVGLTVWYYTVAIPWLVENGLKLLGALLSWLSEAVPTALGKLGELLASLGGWLIGTAIPFLAEKAGGLLGALIGWVAEVVPKLLVGLAGFLQAIGVWIVETAIPWLISATLSFVGTMLLWVLKLAIEIPFYLAKLLVLIGTWIVGAVIWLAEKADELRGAIIQWVIDAAIALPGQLVALASALWGWITTTASELSTKLVALAVAIGEWIITFAAELPGKLAEWATKLWDWVTQTASELPGKFVSIATAITDWVSGLGTSIADAAKNVFLGLTNAFITAVNWIVRTWNDISLTIGPVEILGQQVGPFSLDTPNLSEFATIPSFAKGGRPRLDRPSIIGELGPELFWPDRAGTIMPSSALAAAGGAGLQIGQVTVTGQERPAETAFALRSELRWLSMTAGGN